MNIKKVYILEDRGILFINGDDSIGFIQNLITNDINKVTDTNSCYASLLSPQGKYLFDFIIIRHKNGFIIDCEKDQVNNLFKQLNLYKLRSKVEVLDLSNEFVVAAISLEKYNSFPNSKEILGYTFKYREDPVILDPRHKNLGGRILINLEKQPVALWNYENIFDNNKRNVGGTYSYAFFLESCSEDGYTSFILGILFGPSL